MGLTNFPNGISVHGVQVTPGGGGSGNGKTLPATTGKYWYVQSVNGNAGNSGSAPTKPLATLTAAVAKCRNNAGDVVVLMPNHAETISAAAGIVLNKTGMHVVGLGSGAGMPTFTFDTDTAASMDITSNSISVSGIIGVGGLDALTKPFNVTGNDCTLDIIWKDTSALIEAATAVRLDTADRFKLNLQYVGFTAGNATVRAVAIDDCDTGEIYIDAYGVVTTAWVNMVDVASTNIKVRGKMFTQGITNFSRDVVDTVGGSTWDAVIFDASFGAEVSGGSASALASDDVSIVATAVGAVADAALADTVEGAAATTQSILTDLKGVLQRIGADNANNTAATTLVAANVDGSVFERLESIQQHIGATDSVTNILGANDADNGFDSSAVVANLDGSIVERLEDIAVKVTAVDDIIDTEFPVVATAVGAVADAALADTVEGAAATTQSILTDLKGVLQRIGADNANNTAATTLVAANVDGSVFERLEAIQQHIGATDSVTNILGANDADNGFDSSAVVANVDGSIVERLEDLVVKVTAVDDIIDTEFPVVATAVGAVADAALADTIEGAAATTQSILTDLKGVLQRIGADNANNTAATTLVAANADGSVLERLEDLAVKVTAVDDIIDTEFPVVATAVGAVADAALADTIEGAAAATQSILTDLKGVLQRIGADNADNTAATTLVVANADGSVLERLEDLAVKVTAVDDIIDTEFPVVATAVGAVADAALADTIEGAAAATQSILTDLKGVLQRIGADNADNTAATTLVAANRDGSLLERSEFLMDELSGAAGVAAYPAAEAPANGVPIAAVLRAVYDNSIGSLPLTSNSLNYLAVTADFTNPVWNTVATHEIAAVTGMVRMTVIPECTGTLLDAADGASIQLGVAGATTALIVSTQAAGAGGNTIETGELWIDATPSDLIAKQGQIDPLTFVVANGTDVGYEITGAALTGGSIIFHIWWSPCKAAAEIFAGDGTAL